MCYIILQFILKIEDPVHSEETLIKQQKAEEQNVANITAKYITIADYILHLQEFPL